MPGPRDFGPDLVSQLGMLEAGDEWRVGVVYRESDGASTRGTRPRSWPYVIAVRSTGRLESGPVSVIMVSIGDTDVPLGR